MSFEIYYNHVLESKISFQKREELSIVKISKQNFKSNNHLIQKSIDTFHSEIKWEEMWDLYECEIRLNQNQILYLLLEDNNPIGHVWYEGNYLHNAFVSKQRYDGDSTWFIQETMWDIKNTLNVKSIKLCSDYWNIRAQKFWEKLGYEKLT
jgi:hypothetical protein